jgi:hypothetical protein
MRKIPLDAGFSCPNRDGTLSFGGCVFCNAAGSGTGLLHKGFDLRAQWDRLTAKFVNNPEAPQPWAYLQSFSNTTARPNSWTPCGRGYRLPGGACAGHKARSLDPAKLDFWPPSPCPAPGDGSATSNDRT